MGRPKHPVTLRIEEAMERLEANGMDVTPGAVKVNAEKAITWSDWTPEEAASEALDARIVRVMRDKGYVIADAETRVRKDFWDCTPDELEEQLRIKEESSTFDQNRIRADKAVLEFLREKEKELGYEPYPGLFEGEIERIYLMHKVTPPADGVPVTA